MMPRAIEYREYNPSDIGYVRDIIEYDLGYSVLPDELEGRINEMLSRNDYKIFVACDGEKTVGFKRGEIRKQAKSLKSSRLWTAGKQVTTE